MKKLNILILLFISISLSANELAWVNTQIEAIKPKRDGLKPSTISLLEDPFIFFNDTKTKSTIVPTKAKSYKRSSTSSKGKVTYTYTKGFTLGTIINNSAQINGSWYKLNDIVKGYKLTKIDRTSVVLTRYGKNTLLSTKSKNSTLKFKK